MQAKPSRRDFLKSSAGSIIGIAAAHDAAFNNSAYGAAEKSRIAVVRNERAINDSNVCNKAEAARMIEKALVTITGKNNSKDSWISLGLTAQDVVGIKVNCNRAAFPLFAHPDLISALSDNLATVIPSNNIIIYERRTSELENAGFTINRTGTGVRCYGTDESDGFSSEENLTRIITDKCTKIINVPSLKTFEGDYSGTLFLKNHIGSLLHAHMPNCHGNTGFITEVNARPSIKNKTLLVLCDGLRGTYQRSVPWYWAGIIVGRDPVAAECTALNIINEKRKQENIAEMEIKPYVKEADTKYGLGACDPAKIDVINTIV